MSEQKRRICCDLCGEYIESDGERFAPVIAVVGQEDGEPCLYCDMVQNDYALDHPDELCDAYLLLNYDRFRVRWPGVSYASPSLKPYLAWRKAHPELGGRFNMCDFKEVPGIEQTLRTLMRKPNDTDVAEEILTEEQLDFLKSECGYNPDDYMVRKEANFPKVYDRLCEIEVEDTLAAEDEARELSDRGKMAEGIVTALGNALYKTEDDE